MKTKSKIWISPVMVIAFVFLLANNCKKDEADVLYIGKSYQGGIIAYILQEGDPGYDPDILHGLIAAPTDQGTTGIQWYNGSWITTGAEDTTLGSGNENTNTIVDHQGAGSYAAKLCFDLVLGGYSDWFLPSKDELNKLWLSRTTIGGFTSNIYWSSTERPYDNLKSWYQAFPSGEQSWDLKDYNYYVRAVRAF